MEKEKCDCGVEVDFPFGQVCAGALANEVQQNVPGPIDTTLLLSCYCYKRCRDSCLNSFLDDLKEIENGTNQ